VGSVNPRVPNRGTIWNMEPMRKPSGLQRRRNTWHLRVTVPVPLRPVVGQREIIRSLRTHDYRVACERLPLARAEVNAKIAEARRKLEARPATRLDEYEAKAAALRWFWEDTRDDETAPLPDDRTEAEASLSIDAGVLSNPDDPNVLAPVQRVADEIMARGNLDLDKRGDDYHRLCDLVRRGLLERTRRLQARLRGDYGAVHDPLFDGVESQALEPPGLEPRGVTLGELCDLYLVDPARARVTAKTRIDYDFTFRLIKEVIGADRPVRIINRQNCRDVLDVLATLPPNASKKWPGTPLSQVAAMARERGITAMAPRTANAYLHKLSALFRWAEREEYIDRNPAVGLRVAEP